MSTYGKFQQKKIPQDFGVHFFFHKSPLHEWLWTFFGSPQVTKNHPKPNPGEEFSNFVIVEIFL
jgi:hypothetical protein